MNTPTRPAEPHEAEPVGRIGLAAPRVPADLTVCAECHKPAETFECRVWFYRQTGVCDFKRSETRHVEWCRGCIDACDDYVEEA